MPATGNQNVQDFTRIYDTAEATATMRGFTNNNADERIGIFLAFAIGYIIVVEVISLSSYLVERKVRVAR